MKKNPNTSYFWDQKIIIKNNCYDKDFITKDRINQIVKLLKRASGSLLDIGPGYGYLENRLKKNINKLSIFGIDISINSLIRAKKNLTVIIF